MVDIGSGKRTSNFVSESFAEALRGKNVISRVVTELRVGSSKNMEPLNILNVAIQSVEIQAWLFIMSQA